jgi:hypothetical protein
LFFGGERKLKIKINKVLDSRVQCAFNHSLNSLNKLHSMTQTTTTKWVTKTQLIAIRSDLQAQINGITYVQAKINERCDKNDECYGVKCSLKILRYKFQICTYLYNNNNVAARVSYNKLIATQTAVLDKLMFEDYQSTLTILGKPDRTTSVEDTPVEYFGAPEHESENIRQMGKMFQESANCYGDLLKRRVING